MSASLKSKDGTFSMAAMMAAHEANGATIDRIYWEDALAWAKNNGVKPGPQEQMLPRINSARMKLKLPPFKLIQRRTATAKAHPSIQKALQPTRSHDNGSAVLPSLAGTREDLLALAIAHCGTLTRTITPEVAKWLLELNTANRPMQSDNTARFKTILREGRWINTGEPIIVSLEGILNDGQHRLAAIRDTGIAAEMDVRFGITRNAFKATGTGKRRTVGNILSMEGYTNASSQASIARLLSHYMTRNMGQHQSQVDAAVILSLVEGEDLIGEVAAKIAKYKFAPLRGGSFGFVLVVAAQKTGTEKVFAFSDLVASGAIGDEANAARKLHARLLSAVLRREHITQLDLAVLSVKAWNCWITKKPGVKMRVTEHERTSEGFPPVAAEPVLAN